MQRYFQASCAPLSVSSPRHIFVVSLIAVALTTGCPGEDDDTPPDNNNPSTSADAGQVVDNDDAGSQTGSSDGGSTQPPADAGGSIDAGLLPAVIDWCNIQFPAATTTTANVPTESLFGRVFASGVTGEFGSGPTPLSEVGFGPQGSLPDNNPNWAFFSGSFQQHVDNGFGLIDNDEHSGTIVTPVVGTYSYTWRFSADNGNTWTVCDLDGTDNGIDASQFGTLTVEAPETPDAGAMDSGTPSAQVDWCIFQHPASLSAIVNEESDLIYGRTYLQGVTGEFGTGPTPESSFGYGPLGTDPRSDTGWTWVAGSLYMVVDNGFGQLDNDEHIATVTATEAGEFSTVWRFSADDGTSWTYCDLDSTDNGFSLDQMGTLNVALADGGHASVDAGSAQSDGGLLIDAGSEPLDGGSSAGNAVSWCVLQWPHMLEEYIGSSTETVYGRVYEPGMTGEGSGGGITGQLGYGEVDSPPDQSWTWTDGTFFQHVNNGITNENSNDEFTASIEIEFEGTFDYAWRFSKDNGATWTYCDKDGSDNGYSSDQAGELVALPAE